MGGSTELGAGSVWAVRIGEQSAVLDVVGGSTELGAGSVWAVRIAWGAVSCVGCGGWVNRTGSRISLGRGNRIAVSGVGCGGWVNSNASFIKSVNTNDRSTELNVCKIKCKKLLQSFTAQGMVQPTLGVRVKFSKLITLSKKTVHCAS